MGWEIMAITLGDIAKKVGGEVSGNPDIKIIGAAPFDEATTSDITLAGDAKFFKRISQTKAGAVVVPENFSAPDCNLLCVKNPQVIFARILAFFSPHEKPESGIDKKASVGKNTTHGKGLYVGPNATIGNNVTIGNGVEIHPGCVIGNNASIGDDVVLYPNVTIMNRCIIGNRVIIHPNTVIGSDGFGFAPDGETYVKIPQTGIVQIDDDVEIGSGVAIDRATFGKTWIKQGVKIDNLVQIAHNVIVGENSILVSQVGIAGSVKIGKHAVLAGQAGISGHLTIGDNAIVGPQAGVGKPISDGQVLSGSPAIDHRLWLRVQNMTPRLPEMKKKISLLEKKLNEMENIIKNTLKHPGEK